MKITRLKLLNWRNHAETILKLDRLTVIRGANHSGKSGVQQALEFALTGRCDSTDAKGAGMAGLIRQGYDKAGVLMELVGANTYQATCMLTGKPERTLTFTNPSDPSDRGEKVKAWIEQNRPVLSCLLNSRYFIGLKPADQKTLLSSIILRASHDWGEDVKAKCQQVHIASQIPWGSAPFDVIEAGYKAAFEKRTEINRDIKNLHVPDPLAAPTGLSVSTSAEAREKLAQLTLELNKYEGDRKSAERARIQAEHQVGSLRRRIEDYEARIKQEREVLGTIETLSPKQVKDLEKVAANAKKWADKDAELALIRKDLAGVDAILKMFDALDGKKECPTCGREVTDDWLTAAMAPHIEKKNSLMGRERDALKEQAALGNVAAAQQKLAEYKANETREKRCRALIAENEALLKTSRSELEEIEGNMPPALAADPQEMVDLRAEIANLQKAISELAVVDARAKEIERAKERERGLVQAAATLDWLVSYFGKDGIKAKMLAEDIGPFTDAMNQALAAWGYACSFEIEPYGFRVTNLVTKATLPIELLSGSERLRFAVAFQVALAQVSGIGLVVIDEADILDNEGRSALYELLLASDIDQAIAIGTNESLEVPAVEGVVFYAMQDGKAHQLHAQTVGA